jgi:hypothetical protein
MAMAKVRATPTMHAEASLRLPSATQACGPSPPLPPLPPTRPLMLPKPSTLRPTRSCFALPSCVGNGSWSWGQGAYRVGSCICFCIRRLTPYWQVVAVAACSAPQRTSAPRSSSRARGQLRAPLAHAHAHAHTHTHTHTHTRTHTETERHRCSTPGNTLRGPTTCLHHTPAAPASPCVSLSLC